MAVVDDDLDAGPNEYVRHLDDDELLLLSVDVTRRFQALVSQGVPLPVAQIENHHLLGLLEAMVGPELSMKVREWHLLWLDRQLDNVEAQVRTQLLSSGIFDGAATEDVPGFP